MSFSCMLLGRFLHTSMAFVLWTQTVCAMSGIEISVQPIGNSVKGRALEQQPEVQLTVNDIPDIFNDGYVIASLRSNPTGSTLLGSTRVALVMGVAKFTDLQVLPGGNNFSLMFSAQSSDRSQVSATSDYFSCDGQEAFMDILQQPMLTLRNDPLMGVVPVVQILRNGQRVANANPLISVALELNVPNADFTADSVTTVQAVGGLANFTAIWLTKAATIRESFLPAWQESYGFVDSVTFSLRFSCPGYSDVISRNFEVNPIVRLATQPYSDTIIVKRFVCAGPASGCAINISDYLPPGDKLQTATLDIDVACTDLDQPAEYISSITVAGSALPAGAYDPGPWPACAYAGCRDGECPAAASGGNVRRAVAQLDLRQIGAVDPRTGIYSSKGPPVPVALRLTEQVNLCPCGGAMLYAAVTLRVTVSARAEAQLLPLFQQPVVELVDGDGSRYAFAAKLVSAAILVNPASALLAGAPAVVAAGGVAAFTDLVVTEGGPGYVVRFSIAGGARYVDSEPFGVGYGNYPLVSLDCLDLPCAQPLAKVNVEGSVLFLPPTVALQRAGGARTESTLAVSVR
eukprot:CAMPEP_0172181376 /NCGR_PEP_ID=MMETSP1050-20130122/17780_1 /TAXON_ID=233186 /ORGANISM="Cryptomonas curvata, Strain CCAP979/52" /LENGTH=572 /DNA_ID=CAMNT_0012854645 /DNA_START=83 /DNA_END=1797 /DNA_ORIENTATION=-